MRIYGARIFSKSFGGKIKNFDIGYTVYYLNSQDNIH